MSAPPALRRLEGKMCLVTGASRGIGAGIARRLGEEGAAVALTYVASPERAEQIAGQIEATGSRALTIRADSGDPEAVVAAVDRTAAELGGVDIIVSSAGVLHFKPIEELTIEEVDASYFVNVKAVFVAVKAALPYMPDGGRIITIGSASADRMPTTAGSAYAMSKAAVIGLTRGLARDLGARQITVNNVQPGPIDTDMNPKSAPFADISRSHIALGEYGDIEDVASLVAYLASPEARFVTGASFTIDGGYTA